MAETRAFIGGAIRFVIGMFLAALAFYNLFKAAKRAYRSIKGIGSR
ncbi:MAG: hypothetical protein A4E28_02980 [Methanocella sp. PtaU1.Bin125]|nr:MAG: hypothetical protein A4E28_02980 [Methanocella sp. PtaU1.Bin125]